MKQIQIPPPGSNDNSSCDNCVQNKRKIVRSYFIVEKHCKNVATPKKNGVHTSTKYLGWNLNEISLGGCEYSTNTLENGWFGVEKLVLFENKISQWYYLWSTWICSYSRSTVGVRKWKDIHEVKKSSCNGFIADSPLRLKSIWKT